MQKRLFRYKAFCVLLWMQCFVTASEVRQNTDHPPGVSDSVRVADEHSLASDASKSVNVAGEQSYAPHAGLGLPESAHDQNVVLHPVGSANGAYQQHAAWSSWNSANGPGTQSHAPYADVGNEQGAYQQNVASSTWNSANGAGEQIHAPYAGVGNLQSVYQQNVASSTWNSANGAGGQSYAPHAGLGNLQGGYHQNGDSSVWNSANLPGTQIHAPHGGMSNLQGAYQQIVASPTWISANGAGEQSYAPHAGVGNLRDVYQQNAAWSTWNSANGPGTQSHAPYAGVDNLQGAYQQNVASSTWNSANGAGEQSYAPHVDVGNVQGAYQQNVASSTSNSANGVGEQSYAPHVDVGNVQGAYQQNVASSTSNSASVGGTQRYAPHVDVGNVQGAYQQNVASSTSNSANGGGEQSYAPHVDVGNVQGAYQQNVASSTSNSANGGGTQSYAPHADVGNVQGAYQQNVASSTWNSANGAGTQSFAPHVDVGNVQGADQQNAAMHPVDSVNIAAAGLQHGDSDVQDGPYEQNDALHPVDSGFSDDADRRNGVGSSTVQQPAGSSSSVSADERDDPSYASLPYGYSLRANDAGDRDFARYADDIFSQSGGMRVHYDAHLTPEGRNVVRRFMVDERKAQRAFIWHKLGLHDIHFEKRGLVRPAIVVTDPKDASEYSLDELRRTVKSLGMNGSMSRKGILANIRYLETLLNNEDAEPDQKNSNRAFEFDSMRNVAWNIDHIASFMDTMLHRPRYNDNPEGIDPSKDFMGHFASNDPRFSDSDAVVNYRANARTLILERIQLFTNFAQEHPVPERVNDMIAHLDRLTRSVTPPATDRDSVFRLVQAEHARDRGPRYSFEVNVDAFRPDSDFLYKAVSFYVESTLGDLADLQGSITDVTAVLQDMLNKETQAAKTLAAFVEEDLSTLPDVILADDKHLENNIHKVYQRALCRRRMFHKMTIPFVPFPKRKNPGVTYRIHLTDPESRYGERHAEVEAKRSIDWYKAAWHRFYKPILKSALIADMINTPLREIVLGHFNPRVNNDDSAYVTHALQTMILDCTNLDVNHNAAEMALRHKYEHIVDGATAFRTRQLFASMIDSNDFTTYTMQDFDESRSMTTDSARHRYELQYRMDQMPYATNTDNDGGFVSAYAQKSPDDAVAQQRSAMRTEPIRLALLQRMSAHRTDIDSKRQKAFYDSARDVMRDVAPQLYEEWGTYYVGRTEEQWGLAEGARRTSERQYVILEMDHLRATKIAAERLATRYLLQGYGVAILTHYNSKTATPGCKLQSNLPDSRARTTIVHLVMSSLTPAKQAAVGMFDFFVRLSPTGRLHHSDKLWDFDTVSFVLPSETVNVAHDRQFLFAFGNEMLTQRAIYVKKSRDRETVFSSDSNNHEVMDVAKASVPKLEIFSDTSRSLWPEDPNLYQSSIFAGWWEQGRLQWGLGDMEELRLQHTNAVCL